MCLFVKSSNQGKQVDTPAFHLDLSLTAPPYLGSRIIVPLDLLLLGRNSVTQNNCKKLLNFHQ